MKRSWRSSVLVFVLSRVVGADLLGTSVQQGQLYLRRQKRVDQTRRRRCISDRLLARRLKIPLPKNSPLDYTQEGTSFIGRYSHSLWVWFFVHSVRGEFKF